MSKQEHFMDLGWREVENPKVKAFQHKDEIIYVIKVRDNEYMVLHEDAHGIGTGKVEHLEGYELAIDYGIFHQDHFK